MSYKTARNQAADAYRATEGETPAQRRARRLAKRAAMVVPGPQEIAELLALQPKSGPLADYALQVLSQHGEDGIVHEILRRAGAPNRTAVEIGCGANGGNVGLLAALGFRCLMIDASPELTGIAARLYAGRDVAVVCREVTLEGVDPLLEEHGFSGEIDYLGIDVDGVDFWILAATEVVRPRLIVAEYNQFWEPCVPLTIPYHSAFARNARGEDGARRWPKGYYGVSLAGLVAWGRRYGYRLVASHMGNAFLLREGLCPTLPELAVEAAWEIKTKPTPRPGIAALLERIREGGGAARYFAALGFPLVSID